MPTLEFHFDWESAKGIGCPELASTWASLAIGVNDTILTRVADLDERRLRDHIQVPLYPLAEWLASNWWALLHETDDRNLAGFADRSFGERHALGPVREGYRFPNMQVVSFEERTRVTWKNDRFRWTNLEFLNREGCEWIDKQEFRKTCASFVDAVVARLASCDIRGTFLQEEWQAIQDADQQERKFCETAGILGLDPYSIDELQQDNIFRLEEELSAAVVEEALPILRPDSLGLELSAIQQVLRIGKANSIPLQLFTALRDEVVHSDEYQLREQPWKAGYSLARKVRARLGLDGAPLASWPALSQAIGEPSIARGRLSRSAAFDHVALVDGVVTSSDAGLPNFVFPSRGTSQTARFRFCRGLAELLVVPSSDFLLTTARSHRQQRGRAFAAEFLAPSTGLRDMVHQKVLAEEELSELTWQFGVSPWVIEHQVENHEIAQIKSKVP